MSSSSPGDDGPTVYPAAKARQGEIILRSRQRRLWFLGGLVGFVVLAVVVGFVL